MMDLHMMAAHTVLTTQIMQAVAADPVIEFQLGGALFSPIIVERGPGGFDVRPATETEYFGGHPGLVHPASRLKPGQYRRLKKLNGRFSDADHRFLTGLMLEWAEDYAGLLLGMPNGIEVA